MKTLLIIFAILVVAIVIVLNIGFSNSSSKPKVDISSINWRLPEPSEKTQIEKTFFLSNVDPCKEYYVKEIFDDEFIVACSKGSGWTYYNVHTSQKRIFVTDDKIVADLTAPPSVRNEKKSSPHTNEKYSPPKRQVLIKEAR